MRTGHTHEPNQATVDLDGLGRRRTELPGEPVPGGGPAGPVFVDASGRRGKTLRRIGWALAGVCAAFAVTLLLAVLGGNSSVPWLPLTEPGKEAKAEKAETEPAPRGDPAPSGVPAAAPVATAGSAVPVSDASGAVAPSASAALVPAGATGRPSATPSAPAPGASGDGAASGGATRPAPAPSTAAPSATSAPPTPDPVPTTAAPSQSAEPSGPPAVDEGTS
ncbi:hypothetical protein [Streptomyces sp. NPDC049916]|uniref:hypothetical protein n=1 Tax=Streptomyces sp. NPDC049916 TaxID=3155156 RepID=UPI003446ABEC